MNYTVSTGKLPENTLTFRLKMVKSTKYTAFNCPPGVVMALQPTDAAAWLTVFRQHLDEMFDCIFDLKAQNGSGFEFSPRMDIYETVDFYVIEIDLPGFSEEDYSVAITEATIRIEGAKRQEKAESGVIYFCLERHFGHFCRILEIPPLFNPHNCNKEYKRGVLTVTFPRIKGASNGD